MWYWSHEEAWTKYNPDPETYFWNSSTDWGSVEKHDLGWLILSDRNTNMEEFIISGSMEKIVLDWDSGTVGFSACICKMELMLVRADGRQGSWHFEYSKTSGWCYSEFSVFLDFVLKCHVDWEIMQERGTNWNIALTSHGIPEGMLKTVNPFSSTLKAEHKYLRRKRLFSTVKSTFRSLWKTNFLKEHADTEVRNKRCGDWAFYWLERSVSDSREVCQDLFLSLVLR